ncbi:MAG: hypothetical protein JST85_18515 [Acidobacteria bacterium]|nr:hypothetical protein [Acidobacteriota bacterium]
MSAMAQSPTPSPTPASSSSGAGTDALTELVIVAGNLIPRVQEAIESPLVKGLENFAFWIAVIVMLFSFARLFRENDGATKDLFWWCFRLAVVFTLFGAGRTIINTWNQIGYDIVNVTEFRKVLWDAEIEFDANYQKFTEGMFLVKATGTGEAIAALTTDDVNLRNIASAAGNPSAWSLPNIFIGVTIGRAILQFSQIFLALLSMLILVALRLFAPFAIALAIDRSLAQRISYPFAWSAAVFTMVTPLVSHILGYIVYQVGNMALSIIKPESQVFTLAADGSITGDPNMVGPATAACVVLIVLMIVSSLLLLASPYISYKLAFGQIFEAVSSTAAGWMGALTATGVEIAGITFGSALQRQASETRIEGQAQAEITRGMAAREASDLQSRAHKILGLQSASASRVQSLGAIAGGYAMALQLNEAQRQATTGLIEQSRQQQVVGILADRSYGQRQAGIQASREERDLRIMQGQQNISTLANRGLDMTDHVAGGFARLGGASAPLLPAAEEGAKIITSGARAAADISINNSTTDARVGSVQIAGQSQIENVESTTKMREYAADIYANRATTITNQQAAANNAAARINRDLAAGGVESAYRKQVQGVTQAYQLSLDANQVNLSGALKAAQIMQSSGMKAVRLDQMSQIVSTLSRDLARRTELAMTMRY